MHPHNKADTGLVGCHPYLQRHCSISSAGTPYLELYDAMMPSFSSVSPTRSGLTLKDTCERRCANEMRLEKSGESCQGVKVDPKARGPSFADLTRCYSACCGLVPRVRPLQSGSSVAAGKSKRSSRTTTTTVKSSYRPRCFLPRASISTKNR